MSESAASAGSRFAPPIRVSTPALVAAGAILIVAFVLRILGARGELWLDELWSLKVKIVDPKQELAPYLPALASACIDYIGENPGREVTFPVDSAHAQLLLQQRPAAPAAPAAK